MARTIGRLLQVLITTSFLCVTMIQRAPAPAAAAAAAPLLFQILQRGCQNFERVFPRWPR